MHWKVGGKEFRMRTLAVVVAVLVAGSAMTIGVAPTLATSDASTAGTTIVVEADGSGDYENLWWAIDNASAGDVIEVGPGTYSSSVGSGLNVIDKPLTIRGDPAPGTVGVGPDAPVFREYKSGPSFVLTANASGSTIEGVAFEPLYAQTGLSLSLAAGETLAGVTIQDVDFRRIDNNGRVGIDGSGIDGNLDSFVVERTRFVGSGSDGSRYGVQILDDDDNSASTTGTTYSNVAFVDNVFDGVGEAVDIQHGTDDGGVSNVVFRVRFSKTVRVGASRIFVYL